MDCRALGTVLAGGRSSVAEETAAHMAACMTPYSQETDCAMQVHVRPSYVKAELVVSTGPA